jgi:hypothetical protein
LDGGPTSLRFEEGGPVATAMTAVTIVEVAKTC